MTVAEKSDFTSTSLSADVVDFIDQCAAQSDHVSKFVWGTTVEGRDMVGAIVATRPYQVGDQDDRNVILLLGNIHSGECAGKEALLMMLRELAGNADHPWLQHNVILFAPNYNADGNDRVGKRNRPGQIGPENGMGRRENAQQLDLNRDFCKIDSPEARALVALIDKANPHLFVDCHTTNGSKHRYALTYDIPHNPTTAQPIRDFLRDKVMPEVTQRLDEAGTSTFYYGNFNRDNSKWTTYGHEPRYSTEYVGLRGRLAILSEAYSYISYRDRIFATKAFVSALLDYMTENHAAVHQLLNSVDRELIQAASTEPQRVMIALDAKVTSFELKCKLKGFKEGEPHEYECEFVGKYEPLKITSLPYAYLVPRNLPRVVDRLKMHGVEIEELTENIVTEVEIDTITELNRSKSAFQKHNMVRTESDRAVDNREIEAGTYVIRTSQPLGRFISYMLESTADDGYVFWNFFDDVIDKDAEYPVLRVAKPMKLPTVAITEVEKNLEITLPMIDGPSSLLSGITKAPKWFGKKNWLKTSTFGREMLMDAETASFVNRPSRPYRTGELSQRLQGLGLSKAKAEDVATAKPIMATNGKYAVFSESDRSFLYFLGPEITESESLLELGSRSMPAELFDFNEDENRLAFVTDKGLHLLDLETREVQLVAAEDDQNLVGQLDWVYQEELYGRGNFKGFWWNPDGNHVAFLSLDESPVIPFTVMDHLPVRGKSEVTNYPKAGDPLPKVKVGVATADASAEVVWVDLGQYKDEEILVSNVSWSADGDLLLLQIQNREQTWLDLVATDREGNHPRTLFRDQTPAWIESPGNPAFVNSQEFLWVSPRDGFKRIYQYSLSGELIGQLTSGDWEVRKLLGVDPQKKYCYFTAAKDNAIDLHGYRIELASGKLQQITSGPGTHEVEFSDDFSLFVDTVSQASVPNQVSLCRSNGELVAQAKREH